MKTPRGNTANKTYGPVPTPMEIERRKLTIRMENLKRKRAGDFRETGPKLTPRRQVARRGRYSQECERIDRTPLGAEPLITMAEASEMLSLHGAPPSRQAMRNWAIRGRVSFDTTRRVVIGTTKPGRDYMTTRSAIRAFVELGGWDDLVLTEEPGQ